MGRANRLQVTFAARLFIRKNPNARADRTSSGTNGKAREPGRFGRGACFARPVTSPGVPV